MMANTKFGIYTDLEKYKDIDTDEILKTLTEEELEQLADELDPDVSVQCITFLPWQTRNCGLILEKRKCFHTTL